MLESSDTATRVAVVKGIGNSGIVDFFPDVERIVKDKSQPIAIREQAIYALRRMAPIATRPVSTGQKHPNKVNYTLAGSLTDIVALLYSLK